MDEQAVRQRMHSSPPWQLVGTKILTLSTEEAVVEMTLTPQHLHNLGIVHGGLIASLVDCAATALLYRNLQPGEYTLTIEFKVNFLAPGRGSKLAAEARFVRRGRRVAVVAVDVRDDRGEMVAHGITTEMIERGAAAGAS